MLEYDNSAFYYFGITMCVLYAVPVTYFSCKRIIYGVFLKDRLLDKHDVRCEREMTKIRQLQAEKTSLRNIFNIRFVLNLILLAIVWYAMYYMILLVKDDSEIKSFDPFAILEIAAGASDREIKRAYRKMSLQYHPDKNKGDPIAESKFMLIAKAYEALTDEVAKENYEKYGNPDGRQALQLSIGLPTFLLDKSNHTAILFIYLIILVIAIPSVVALWYSHSKKYGDSMIMYDSYGFYNYTLSEHTHVKALPEILAGSAEYREIPKRESDEAELQGILRELKQDSLFAKPKFNHPSINKANLLLHAHILRRSLSPALQADLNQILKKAIHLIDGMLEIAVAKAWFQTTINIIDFEQYITQGLWTKDSPFLQIPRITEAEVKHIMNGKNAVRRLQQYLELDPETRKGLVNFSEEEKKEINRVCDILPNVDMEAIVEVEDEDQIAEGDILTVTVRLTRKNVKEGDTCDLVYAPHFPYPKPERWYCMVGNARMNHLHAFSKITSQERVVEEKLRLQAPPNAGSYQLDVVVKSDSYIGVDMRTTVTFNVISAEELPAYVPHPEDVALDNEPTLFEQVMSGALDDDSSDSEDEEDDDKED